MNHNNSVSVENIQNVVKTVKFETLDQTCDYTYMLPYMLFQVKAVEQKLQIESSEQIDESLTIGELKTAAEMFLYLNTCPDSSWFKSWYSFYKDLFLTQSADQIILTLNRMMKTETAQDKDGKRIARKLFQRAASLLSLQFEKIGSLLRGKYFEDISSTNFKIPKGAIFHHNLSFSFSYKRFR